MPVRKVDKNERKAPTPPEGPGKRAGNKKTLRLVVGIIAVIVILCLLNAACSAIRGAQENAAEEADRAAHAGQVQLPSMSFYGDNYEDAVTALRTAGFTNVKAKPEKVTSSFSVGTYLSEGQVIEVSVNGDTYASMSDWFQPDAKVVVRYKSDSSGAKEQKDAFDSSEKTTLKVAGLSFDVPTYFKKDKDSSGKKNSYYYASMGKRLVMLASVNLGSDVVASSEDFYAREDDFVDSFVEGTGFKNSKKGEVEETKISGQAAFTCDISGKLSHAGVNTTDKLVAFYNDESGEVGVLCLVQSDKAKYDYSSDFEKIVASAKAS